MVCWSSIAFGQTEIEKAEPIKAGETVQMDFTWPEVVTIKTWDSQEVKVVAHVDINKGQNDDAFQLTVEKTSSGLSISSSVKDMEKLPHKVVIRSGGKDYFFDTDDMNSKEIKDFKKEHGDVQHTSYGPILDITVEVFVPNNIQLDAYCKFSLLEVIGFTGTMKVQSKFGGVDVTSGKKGTLKAGTKFGQKYTNLNATVTTISVGDHPGKWDWVAFKLNGDGTEQEVKSEFGNVYIREL